MSIPELVEADPLSQVACQDECADRACYHVPVEGYTAYGWCVYCNESITIVWCSTCVRYVGHLARVCANMRCTKFARRAKPFCYVHQIGQP